MGAVYYADPLRRSLTGVITVVLAVLTLAAGIYFALSATRGITDPRPAMLTTLDRLEVPTGASLLHQRATGGVACDGTGCPTVERFWAIPATVAETCADVRTAVGDWGGIRFQELQTSDCGYLGVMGPDRLAFSVEDTARSRVPQGVELPNGGSVLRVTLTRD